MPLPPNSNLTLPLLISGSSSVGKSTVARQISEQFQVPCVHLDAYFEQIPDPGLNLFPTHHNPWELSANELRDQIIQTGQNATPYIHALVDTYEKKGRPVIEGERIIPLLVERLRQFQKAVGIFIFEEAPHRLYETLQNRSKRFLALTETQNGKLYKWTSYLDNGYGWRLTCDSFRGYPLNPGNRSWNAL